MKVFKKLIGTMTVLGVGTSVLMANGADLLVGGIIGSIITASHPSHYQQQRPHYSKRSSIPHSCQKGLWSTQMINNEAIATSFHGVSVKHDAQGAMIVAMQIQNPLPNIFSAGDNVQLNLHFNKRQKLVNATVDQYKQNLIVSGLDAMYIISKLKSASYAKVDFVNNSYCTRLKGSSNAIKTVENTYVPVSNVSTNNYQKANHAVQARPNAPKHLENDSINNARVSRAIDEHMTHAQRLASNQKEYAEKVAGIREKSDLEAADANIYDVKIQYYVPGSEEIGEMWIDWFIDDEKGPMMRLHFMDPTHKYENESHKIDISLEPIESVCNTDINIKTDETTSPSCEIVKDLLIANKWATIAKKQEMKRRYKKRVSFIQGNENSKKSLGINFQVYENGGMTAQLEELNHGYPKRFNFTFAQALELARYIENTRKKAHKKWMNKTRTKEDLDALFQ